MRRDPSRLVLVLLVLLGFAQVSWSQQSPPPTIHNVTSQILATGEVVLVVTGVGFGEAPVVTVDGAAVPALAGASDNQISVRAPAALLTTPGTYRVTVVDSVRQVGDAFVVVSLPGTAGVTAMPLGGIGGEFPTAAATPSSGVGTGETGVAVVPPLAGPGGTGLLEDTAAPYSTGIGYQALYSNSRTGACGSTMGCSNTATGYQALMSNTNGQINTATGWRALFLNTTGNRNSAFGGQALYGNTTGWYNTALGTLALTVNSGGSNNVATGYSALYSNTSGGSNVANGVEALFSNTGGSYNTASGYHALNANTTGGWNTGSGVSALASNTTGYYNMASGAMALVSNSTGGFNTASGASALTGNTTGSYNTAIGYLAGSSATTGNYNLLLGAGVFGTAAETNTIRIGSTYDGATNPPSGQNQTFIAGIRGTSVSNALPVVIDTDGKLGTGGLNNVVMGSGTALPTWSGNVELNNEAGVGFHFRTLSARFDIGPGSGGAPTYPGLLTLAMDGKVGIGTTSPAYKLHVAGDIYTTGTYQGSDRRLKDQVHNLGYGVREVLRLRPVSYRWKDAALGRPTLGLIAQEVEPVLPELVAHGTDEAGLLSVNYTGLIPVLVKAVQEQETKLNDQHAALVQQDAEIAALRTEAAALRAEGSDLRQRLAALEQRLARLLKQLEPPQSD